MKSLTVPKDNGKVFERQSAFETMAFLVTQTQKNRQKPTLSKLREKRYI